MTNKIPIFQIDECGDCVHVGSVKQLKRGEGYSVEVVRGVSSVLLGEQGDGVYDDLPYFLHDLRPQGFIGRQIARQINRQCDEFPADPRYWNSSHIFEYLTVHGDDLGGNFIVGELGRLYVPKKPVPVSQNDYCDIADKVVSGEVVGSSAGGEQAKFAVYNRERATHVIVKFSPKGDGDIATRWRDILITEHHASEAWREFSFALAAETRLVESGDRLFLESTRFDRVGEYGRRPMISLQSIDSEFAGIGSGWPHVMNSLLEQGFVVKSDVRRVESLWHFGRQINNTDMHLGNLAFSIDGNRFKLLPVYDMCCMGFVPLRGGEVPLYTFKKPLMNEEQGGVVGDLVDAFWRRVSSDERISLGFREFVNGVI